MHSIHIDRFVNLFPGVHSFRRAPLIRYKEGHTINKVGLQQVYANFNKFHILNPETGEVLTYVQHPRDASRVVKQEGGEEDVREFYQLVHSNEQYFGRNVARLAHGFDVSELPSGSRSRAPDWKQVKKSQPTPTTSELEYLRRKLKDDRMLKFIYPEQDKWLGIRAQPSGEVQYEVFNLQEPPSKFRSFFTSASHSGYRPL